MKFIFSILLFVGIAFVSGCQAISGLSQGSAIETGVFQTLEVGSLLTQIAQGREAINTLTAEPSIIEEGSPTQENTDTVACPVLAGQPSLNQLDFPEELGEISENNGVLLLNDTEVIASFQSDVDCNQVIWLSLTTSTEWPIFIKGINGEWLLGATAWNGKLEIVNATDFPVSLTLEPLDVDQSISSEPQEFPLTGYEIFDMSFLPPGQYKLSFSYLSNQLINGSCLIDLGQTSVFLFTITSIGVAVFEESFIPEHSDDVNINSSVLCGS
jgi:hypothetical protein